MTERGWVFSWCPGITAEAKMRDKERRVPSDSTGTTQNWGQTAPSCPLPAFTRRPQNSPDTRCAQKASSTESRARPCRGDAGRETGVITEQAPGDAVGAAETTRVRGADPIPARCCAPPSPRQPASSNRASPFLCPPPEELAGGGDREL